MEDELKETKYVVEMIGESEFAVLYITPKQSYTFEFDKDLKDGYFVGEYPSRLKYRKELVRIIKDELKIVFNNKIKYYCDSTRKYEEY